MKKRIINRKVAIFWIAIILLLLSACGAKTTSKIILRIATTTSLDNSGLLEFLIPEFENQYGYSVDVIAVGTGQALSLGERGDVDLVLVHAENLELQFINNGFGYSRHVLMKNDFVILGPLSDPANIKEFSSTPEALLEIARYNLPFVSRGDQSGTHVKELMIWDEVGGVPSNFDEYISAGQGMGASLVLANEVGAYILSDRGTYLSQRENLPYLSIVFGGETALDNPDPFLENIYSAIAINPEIHPHVRFNEANQFIRWISSDENKSKIERFRFDEYNQSLFYPIPSPLTFEEGLDIFNENESTIWQKLKPILFRTIQISGSALIFACLLGLPLGVWLGLSNFRGRKIIQMLIYTGMGFPPVVIGLLVFLILSQQGPLSFLEWLFQPQAMILAQTALAIPLAAGLTNRAIRDVSPQLVEQIIALGADKWQIRRAIFFEARKGIIAAVMAAFGRIISEVGAVMLVGGNIVDRTRVLSTAIVLETRQGNFETALALGIILLGIALATNMVMLVLQGETK